MGVALFVVQLGSTPSSTKPLKGFGSGVYEILEGHDGGAYRAVYVYVVKVGEAVHVLHAFQKKAKSGIATPRPDIHVIEQRLKTVMTYYKE
jgi:phage-related protein